jgi:hypothetical protein
LSFIAAPPLAFIGDEIAITRSRLLNEGSSAMRQQYFKRNTLLDQRLDDAAARLRKGAHGTSPGVERERFISRACPAEPAAQIEWLASPGLQPDK